ncbi:MAG: PilN domain-containing protein [Armatimonadota bacterium]
MIDINLVAERQRERRSRERLARVALFAAMFFFVLTVVATTGMLTKMSGKRGETEKVKAEIRDWMQKQAAIDATREQIAEKEPLVKLLNEARFSQLRWCRVLQHVHTSLPAQLKLTSVRSSSSIRPRVRLVGQPGKAPEGGQGLTITGEALQQEAVGVLIANLGKGDAFQDVYLNYSRAQRQAEGEVYQFELIAMLTPIEGGATP